MTCWSLGPLWWWYCSRPPPWSCPSCRSGSSWDWANSIVSTCSFSKNQLCFYPAGPSQQCGYPVSSSAPKKGLLSFDRVHTSRLITGPHIPRKLNILTPIAPLFFGFFASRAITHLSEINSKLQFLCSAKMFARNKLKRWMSFKSLNWFSAHELGE